MRKLILLSILVLSFGFSAFSQDLIIESMTIEASYHRHSAFTYSATVKNIGVIPSNTGRLKVYFGNDENDYSSYFSQNSIPALAADESITLNFEIGGSEYLDDMDEEIGTYYVNALIDPNAYNFLDVDPSNNKYQAGITEVIASTADIILSNFNLNPSANLVQGGELSMTIDATNPGSNIRGVHLKAYLSDDAVFDQNDIELGSSDYLRFDFQSNTIETVLKGFEIPFNLNSGEYYIFLKLDYLNRVEEVNEANNIYQEGTAQIADSDAILSINEASTEYYWTENGIDISFEITNTGSTDVSYFNYYTSPYMGGGGYASQDPFGAIEAGETIWESFYLSDYEISGGSIFIGNNDPNYPYINEVEVYIGSKPSYNYNFNISDVYLSSSVETEDSDIPITIELENPNGNSIYESGTVDITLESLDGQVIENYSISKSVSLYDYGTDLLNISLPYRSTLKAGNYNVTAEISLDYKDGGAGPFMSQIEILASEYNIDVEILGQNGDVINQGMVYFYEKTDEGTINYLDNKNIEEIEGVGKVSFLQSAGNYMFFVVPDESRFPNYLRTVSGNTFKLEESSFTEISSNATLQIEPIYVDPNGLNGSKIIEGNIASGTSTSRTMTYAESNSVASFDETPVYLVRDNSVVAFTYTDASGNFSFTNLEDGSYEVYFDDGNIIETNDITAAVVIEEPTDVLKLNVSSTGNISVQDFQMNIDVFALQANTIESDELVLPLKYNISNTYKHNAISITEAFFYFYIKQDGEVIDSIGFIQDISLSENDTIRLGDSFQLSDYLSTGSYEVEMHYTTPYQTSEVLGTKTIFNVIEPHFDIEVSAFDMNDVLVTNGLVQLYKINSLQTPVLVEEKPLSLTAQVTFKTPTCDYFINVIPNETEYPNLLPTLSDRNFDYSAKTVENLSSDVEIQVELLQKVTSVFNGNRKLAFNLGNDNFDYNQTRVLICNPADTSIIHSSEIQENEFDVEGIAPGDYLFFFDDENVINKHEKWYSLTVNDSDDYYVIEMNGEGNSLDKFDYDFDLENESSSKIYSNATVFSLGFDVTSYSTYYPDELINVDFKVTLESQEFRESSSFYFSEDLNFNLFSNLGKAIELDSILEKGLYDVTISYSTEFTEGFVTAYEYTLQVIDANVALTKLELKKEVLQHDYEIPLDIQLKGSTDSLSNLDVFFNHKLVKANDTIFIDNHQRKVYLDVDELGMLSYTLNLSSPIEIGDYKLITTFNSNVYNEATEQIIQTDFRVRNKQLSLSKLNLPNEIFTLSDSITYHFEISANDDDSIHSIEAQLVSYLVSANDTINRMVLDFIPSVPKSTSKIFTKVMPLGEEGFIDLNSGNYKLIVDLIHPIEGYSQRGEVAFRVKDPSIEISNIVTPDEIGSSSKEIEIELEVSGNNNDNIRSLQTDFKIVISNEQSVFSDTIVSNSLHIEKSNFVLLQIPVGFNSLLEEGEYRVEVSYRTTFNSAYSAISSDYFKVINDVEVTSNTESAKQVVKVYPNPFKSKITIDGDFEKAYIYNQNGKVIRTYQNGFDDLGSISSGVYILVIEQGEKLVHKKLIKK